MYSRTHEDSLFLRTNARHKLRHFLEFLDPKLHLPCYFGKRKHMQIDLLARLAQRPVLTIFPLILCNQILNEGIILRIRPRVAKRKFMLILAAEGMLKGQLKTLLSLNDPVLLDWDTNSGPIRFLLASKHRQMPLFEKLDLIAHVLYAERNS